MYLLFYFTCIFSAIPDKGISIFSKKKAAVHAKNTLLLQVRG